MNAVFEKDLYRYFAGRKETFRQRMLRPQEIRYIRIMRKLQSAKGIAEKWYILRLMTLSRKTKIQIPATTKIGEGFFIGHNGRVIINGDTIIGKNVNVATGVTIGAENRGSRKGCPTIGDRVWIGTNSVIVGKINIGEDVMIAPLTFVNFDVPPHSIVVGNPAKIVHKDNATEAYIENTVD